MAEWNKDIRDQGIGTLEKTAELIPQIPAALVKLGVDMSIPGPAQAQLNKMHGRKAEPWFEKAMVRLHGKDWEKNIGESNVKSIPFYEDVEMLTKGLYLADHQIDEMINAWVKWYYTIEKGGYGGKGFKSAEESQQVLGAPNVLAAMSGIPLPKALTGILGKAFERARKKNPKAFEPDTPSGDPPGGPPDYGSASPAKEPFFPLQRRREGSDAPAAPPPPPRALQDIKDKPEFADLVEGPSEAASLADYQRIQDLNERAAQQASSPPSIYGPGGPPRRTNLGGGAAAAELRRRVSDRLNDSPPPPPPPPGGGPPPPPGGGPPPPPGGTPEPWW